MKNAAETNDEIIQRRDAAIRRALNTPPKSVKSYIGTTERAQTQRKSPAKKSGQSGPDKTGPSRGVA